MREERRWKRWWKWDFKESRARALVGFDSFVVHGGLSLEGLALACLEEDVGIIVDSSVIEMNFSEAADVVDSVVQEVEFERV